MKMISETAINYMDTFKTENYGNRLQILAVETVGTKKA